VTVIAAKIPIVQAHRRVDARLPTGFFTDLLRRHFNKPAPAHQLDLVVDGGRYAELYDYDTHQRELVLETLDADRVAPPPAADVIPAHATGAPP
jgi:hypothetical protein